MLAGCVAAVACGRSRPEELDTARLDKLPALRSVSPVPIGCCTTTDLIGDPSVAALLARNFSQITPEYEMKMGMLLADDGRLRFDAADRLMAFAKAHSMRVHGTTLVWYKQEPAYFQRLKDDRARFEAMCRTYIHKVVGRYRGRIAGWDVVNEPVSHLGESMRESLWSRTLGAEDYIRIAFDAAHEADPGMIAFINDYKLESLPIKRKRFMGLVERLLKKGVKIGGIGTQSHVTTDLPKGSYKAAITDLAGFGLPIHISELDISMGYNGVAKGEIAEQRKIQARIADEVCDSFLALPVRQRYALTLWGLRDSDSWLLRPPFDAKRNDEPLAFDSEGKAKPLLATMIRALQRNGSVAGEG